jgi:HSP20 family molecular chaperone IbpA
VSLTLGSQALFLKVSVPDSGEPRLGVAAGDYEMRVELPLGSGPDAIDAALSNGVLRVRVSKENSGARRVTIITGDSAE